MVVAIVDRNEVVLQALGVLFARHSPKLYLSSDGIREKMRTLQPTVLVADLDTVTLDEISSVADLCPGIVIVAMGSALSRQLERDAERAGARCCLGKLQLEEIRNEVLEMSVVRRALDEPI